MKHFSSLRTPESIRFRNFNKFSQFLNLTLLILRLVHTLRFLRSVLGEQNEDIQLAQ